MIARDFHYGFFEKPKEKLFNLSNSLNPLGEN